MTVNSARSVKPKCRCEERDRFEAEVCGPVAPRELEGHQNLAVGPQCQPFLGDGRTQEIAAELLEPISILACDGNAAMQVEAVKARL